MSSCASISGVFQAAAGMCLVVLGVRVALVDAGVHEAVRLVVCTGVAAVVYLALCAWRVPELASRGCAVCCGAAGPAASGSPARRCRRVLIRQHRLQALPRASRFASLPG